MARTWMGSATGLKFRPRKSGTTPCSLINAIYAEAMKANDFRTLQFLDWFVKEQGEEEKNANDLLGRFDLFASDIKGLYALDSEMGARTYSAPSLTL